MGSRGGGGWRRGFCAFLYFLGFLGLLFFGEALLCLDNLPVTEDSRGVLGALFAEDVRVAANHLLVDFPDHVSYGEAAFFLSDLGVEQHLEKEVAEFFGEFGVIAGLEGIEDFVGFFDEIGSERSVSLFAIPGAAARGTEAGHDRDESFESGPDSTWAAGFRF